MQNFLCKFSPFIVSGKEVDRMEYRKRRDGVVEVRSEKHIHVYALPMAQAVILSETPVNSYKLIFKK